jgi:hypothetical protein
MEGVEGIERAKNYQAMPWANTVLEPTPTALEFMDGLSYKTVNEIVEPLARRLGSTLDR